MKKHFTQKEKLTTSSTMEPKQRTLDLIKAFAASYEVPKLKKKGFPIQGFVLN